MKTYIQKLSPINEFFVVTFVLFGYLIFNSSKSLYCKITFGKAVTFTNLSVIKVLSFEVFALFFVCTLLSMRGYSTKDIQVEINFNSTIYGFWLLLKYYFSALLILVIPIAIISMTIYDLSPYVKNPMFRADLSYIAISGITLINPVFEELALMRYLFTSIEKIKSTNTALYLSLVVRLSYHLYQGLGVLMIAIFGYIMGKAFIKKRNIWPLIVCHACLDLISLVTNKIIFAS